MSYRRLTQTLGGGFLTDADIIENKLNLFVEGFDPERAECASYELQLGEEVYISGQDYPRILSEEEPYVTIPRGQFALLLTKEYIKMPHDYLGFISFKFGLKRQGLVNISGFHVDPGFEGRLVFSVFNAGPADVILKCGQQAFILFFYKLHKAVKKPYHGDKARQRSLDPQVVTSLKGTSTSLTNVDQRLGQLEVAAKVYTAILAAVAAGVALLLLVRFLGSNAPPLP